VWRAPRIAKDLIPHYGEDYPVAVCYRTTWPDQDKVTGTLKDIVQKVRYKKFYRTALVLVGYVLDSKKEFEDPYLYDQAYVYCPKVKRGPKHTVETAMAHPTAKMKEKAWATRWF